MDATAVSLALLRQDDYACPENTPLPFSHLRDKSVRIVAFGDSLTQVNHWTYGHLNWVGHLSMGLGHVFPQGTTVINSGIGGNHVTHGLARLERDVLAYQPDIVLICFGMNDITRTTPDDFGDDLAKMVRLIRENTAAVIVLRTPNPMVDMFTGKELTEIPDGKVGLRTTNLAEFARRTVEVAQREKTLLVDHYALWRRSMESSCAGDLILLMGNPQHPNHLGHRRLYYELAPLFNARRYFYYEWERILADTQELR